MVVTSIRRSPDSEAMAIGRRRARSCRSGSHRNHVVVPSPDEEEHQHDGQGRLRNREDDILENLPADCASMVAASRIAFGKVPYTDDNRYVPNALWITVKMMTMDHGLLYRPISLNMMYSGYRRASCGSMFASMINRMIQRRPLTRPMPRAKELNTDSTTQRLPPGRRSRSSSTPFRGS